MEVSLKNKSAFVEVLKDYEPSEEAKNLLADMPLVILQGVSGSGRNTLIDYIVAHGNFHTVVSDTTRPPKVRDGRLEQDGIAYHFRSEDELLADLKKGMFLEAELIHDQQVSGINIQELVRASKSGKTPINEVARDGVVNIRRAKPTTIFFFIVPPSYDVWLQRLAKREVMSDEELSNRKRSAISEIDTALATEDFHFVVNDTVERAASIIQSIAGGAQNIAENNNARAVASAIRAKLLA